MNGEFSPRELHELEETSAAEMHVWEISSSVLGENNDLPEREPKLTSSNQHKKKKRKLKKRCEHRKAWQPKTDQSPQVIFLEFDAAHTMDRKDVDSSSNASSSVVSFSMEPKAVYRFKSLMQYDEFTDPPPPTVPPFVADVLIRILLFLPVANRFKYWPPLAVSHTCRMWRYYANYLPHWSVAPPFRLLLQGKDHMPASIQGKLLTRDEQCQLVNWSLRKQRCRSLLANFIPLLYFMFATAVLAGNLAIGWALGHSDNALDSDMKLGATAFFTVLVVVAIEMFVVAFTDGEDRLNSFRKINHLSVLFVLTLIFGVVFALVGARIKDLEHLMEYGEFTLVRRNASCDATPLPRACIERLPAVVSLGPIAAEEGLQWTKQPPGARDEEPANATNVTAVVRDFSKAVPTPVTFYELGAIDFFNTTDTNACSNYVTIHGQNNSVVVIPLLVGFIGFNVTVDVSNGSSFRVARHTDWFDASGGLEAAWYSPSNAAWDANGIFLLNPSSSLQSIENIVHKRDGLVNDIIKFLAVLFAIKVLILLLNFSTRNEKRMEKIAGGVAGVCAIVVSPLTLIIAGIICLLGDRKPEAFMCDAEGGSTMLAVGIVLTIILVGSILGD